MTKAGFLKTDWFLGVAVVIFVVLFNRLNGLIPSLERKAYDLGVVATSRAPLDKIAIIAIDEQSLASLGPWPWSRDVLVKMTDQLSAAKAKVIAYTVPFSDLQAGAGHGYIVKLLEMAGAGAPTGAAAVTSSGALAPFIALLKEAEQSLNSDRRLADSFARAGNVVAMDSFEPGESRAKPEKPLPEYVTRNRLAQAGNGAESGMLTVRSAEFPIEVIGKASAALGPLGARADVDGRIRTEPLVLGYFDQAYPSMSLLVAARSLNLGVDDIKVRPGAQVSLGKLNIATDSATQMHTYFYKDRDGRSAFPVDSFHDVLTGKIPASKYQDKIVLVGLTKAGPGNMTATPVSPAVPQVLMLAHSVSSILSEHFFTVPAWAFWVELLVFALVAAYLIALLPRLKAGAGAFVTAVLVGLLLLGHFALMASASIWLQLMLPLALLLTGHVLLAAKRIVQKDAVEVKAEAAPAESSRMLGLAFQGQGQLDLAWDKFRKLPLDDGLMENLYNLALDFERKQQFSQAETVFRHLANHNSKFRDLEVRLKRGDVVSETVVLGVGTGQSAGSKTAGTSAGAGTDSGAAGAGAAASASSSSGKQMLGRYQVEKELGKGAMGVVYQGKDPKIGRVVAIKTMALSQEFEPDELAEVKERFFREAETAGRLSHPNIVTIFDAGEDHELCYIAMELLKGTDLIPYTRPDNLLPVDKVVSIVARVADALGYAHKKNIVHRDVKPANIMYDPDSDTPKVTDFGIARITDSSKTKTGMVLGTPSYMSPEQLSGKKVDGLSDLYSLAVSLYQMLCGSLPFAGGSMAQLMFKIANEPPTDILSIRPDLPPGLVAFLDTAMAKGADERYQTGDEFAAALRASYGSGAMAAAGGGSLDMDISL